MAKKTIEIETDLTPEGQTMWDNILNYEKLHKGKTLIPKEEKKLSVFEMEIIFIRREIRKLIKNSEAVIADCDELILTYDNMQDYLTSDVKVAKTIHENLIKRLQRVLFYQEAFDHKIEVEEEALENALFRDTFQPMGYNHKSNDSISDRSDKK